MSFSITIPLPEAPEFPVNLTVDSLMNVINKLGDVTDNPQSAAFGSNIEKLTPEQIQIATNKGWTISY